MVAVLIFHNQITGRGPDSPSIARNCASATHLQSSDQCFTAQPVKTTIKPIKITLVPSIPFIALWYKQRQC